MVYVKGGEYIMGNKESNSDIHHPHKVRVSSFYIGKYEVSQALWKKVTGKNPSYFTDKGVPVHNITWYEAIKFCNKLSRSENLQEVYDIHAINNKVTFLDNRNGYRLPTEAEWEYAARGGHMSTETLYSGSNDPNEVAWFYDNSETGPQKSGLKKPNELGIFDMSGNFYEWCWDIYNIEYYKKSVYENPKGYPYGQERIVRGGAWLRKSETCSVYFRRAISPKAKELIIGLRLVRSKFGDK